MRFGQQLRHELDLVLVSSILCRLHLLLGLPRGVLAVQDERLEVRCHSLQERLIGPLLLFDLGLLLAEEPLRRLRELGSYLRQLLHLHPYLVP